MWISAPEGRLTPWQQARALALREASTEIHNGTPKLDWIAERLTKVGGGHPKKGSPSEFFKKADDDCSDKAHHTLKAPSGPL